MACNRAIIRRIKASDVDALFAMMQALAAHENLSEWLRTDAAKLKASGFSDHPKWLGFITEIDGVPCGFATYTVEYHIWTGAPVIRLDDIYVDPKQRSLGCGEGLMHKVFAEAEAVNAIVTWSVRADNERAIAFYERLGAKVEISGKCIWYPKTA